MPPWFSQETSGRCMDFMHAEIRNERFALVEETLGNYDCAGFVRHLSIMFGVLDKKIKSALIAAF